MDKIANFKTLNRLTPEDIGRIVEGSNTKRMKILKSNVIRNLISSTDPKLKSKGFEVFHHNATHFTKGLVENYCRARTPAMLKEASKMLEDSGIDMSIIDSSDRDRLVSIVSKNSEQACLIRTLLKLGNVMDHDLGERTVKFPRGMLDLVKRMSECYKAGTKSSGRSGGSVDDHQSFASQAINDKNCWMATGFSSIIGIKNKSKSGRYLISAAVARDPNMGEYLEAKGFSRDEIRTINREAEELKSAWNRGDKEQVQGESLRQNFTVDTVILLYCFANRMKREGMDFQRCAIAIMTAGYNYKLSSKRSNGESVFRKLADDLCPGLGEDKNLHRNPYSYSYQSLATLFESVILPFYVNPDFGAGFTRAIGGELCGIEGYFKEDTLEISHYVLSTLVTENPMAAGHLFHYAIIGTPRDRNVSKVTGKAEDIKAQVGTYLEVPYN